METTILAASLAALTIPIVIFFSLLKEAKNSSFNKKETPLIILGLIYLIFTATLFIWGIDFFRFNTADFIVIFSTILIVQTICILTILHKVKKNKKIFYISIPLVFLIPLTLHAPESTHLIIPISFLVLLLGFLTTASIHKTHTRYLMLYTSASLFLYIFAIFWQNLIPILTLTSSILFLIFLIFFLKYLQNSPHQHSIYQNKPESPFIHFLKHLVFIIIITNFVFVGTVSVHEFGHLLTSSQSNCEEVKIVYELKGLPHTEIKCADTAMQNRWIAGGVLLPLAVAFFLFFCGGKFIKELALQIIGFNLIISYLDIEALGFSEAIATFILTTGAVLVALSLALLAKSRTE